jgi:hypothetical protein
MVTYLRMLPDIQPTEESKQYNPFMHAASHFVRNSCPYDVTDVKCSTSFRSGRVASTCLTSSLSLSAQLLDRNTRCLLLPANNETYLTDLKGRTSAFRNLTAGVICINVCTTFKLQSYPHTLLGSQEEICF